MSSKSIWKLTAVLLVLIALITYGSPIKINFHQDHQSNHSLQIVKPVLANDIYPKFTCPCCGQPLNKEEPCCGAMTQMIDFIDQQIILGLSEDNVILATAKQFGIDRLTHESNQIALKQQLIESAPADAPSLQLIEVERDLGTISQSDGKIHTDFQITNTGKSDLIIDKLSSSCGCTSASVIYQNTEGPEFTMPGHGKENPTGWSITIAPGDSATLRVYYDPTVHPDLVGDVTRTVSIFSNDPVNFEQKIAIALEQVK